MANNILVTGGFGYVGSRLTPYLLHLGHRVRVLDLMLYTDAGLEALRGDPSFPRYKDRFELIRGDIRDSRTVETALEGMDTVIHLAAISNDPTGAMDEVLTRQVNFDAVGVLLCLARAAGVKRFINASSSSVFGIKDVSEVTESLEPEPLTSYSRYKMLSEWLVTTAAAPDFCTVNLRPATVCGYSPRQRFDLTVNKLTADAVRKGVITVHGGQQRRPNVGISDMINVYAQLVEADPGIINGRTFNFGFENLKVIEIAKAIQAELSDLDVEIRITNTLDHRDYHISSEKILEQLPYRPLSSIRAEVANLRKALEGGAFPDIDAPQYYNINYMKLGRTPACYDFLSRPDARRNVAHVTAPRYPRSENYSSAKPANQYFDRRRGPVQEFCVKLAAQLTPREFHDAVESFSDLKVLVVGDTIFDRYSSVKVQGLTSKNRMISGRFLSEETQFGGAFAAFRHVRQFVRRVKFISLVGTEPWVEPCLREQLAPEEDRIIRADQFTTIIKQRFVEPLSEGKEMSKLFAVNYIDAAAPGAEIQEKVMARLEEEIKQADAVLLLDFGHGLLQPRIRRFLEESARFLALVCQTNSNNHGFNVISRQYRRATAFALDEQELMLSAGHRDLDYPTELDHLRRQLQAQYAWLTRGAVETIGLLEHASPCLCPTLETGVVDTIGAGDAFFSVAALAAARQMPIGLATFLGQLAGGQAVKVVGNAHPISKQTLLQSGMSLLNF